MSERYSKLLSLPENIYAEGSPLIITAGNLLKDTRTGKVLVQLKLRNLSAKRIKAASVVVHARNTAGKTLNADAEMEYLDLSTVQGEEFGQRIGIPLPNASTRGVSVEATQAVFEDISTWDAAGESWEPLPAPQSLDSALGDPELVRQFQIHFGGKCEVMPRRHKDLWFCACGAWNKDRKCYCCGKNKDDMLSVDLAALNAEKEARLAEERAKAAAEKAAAEEQARKTKKAMTITLSVLAVCLAVFLAVKLILPAYHYRQAEKQLENGQYDEAEAAFEALAGYRDSEAMIQEVQRARTYAGAETLLEEAQANVLQFRGTILEAAKLFSELQDYRDAPERLLACRSMLNRSQSVAAGFSHTAALRADGTVLAVGSDKYGQCQVDSWQNIVSIDAGDQFTVALRSNGTVAATGFNSHGQCDVEGWRDILAVVAGNSFALGLKADGTVVATGSNKHGQCDVEEWQDIVAIAAGDSHTVGLKPDGTAVAVGLNNSGQCDVEEWQDIVAIAAGDFFTLGLRMDGTVVAAGQNNYGQCDVDGWTDIVMLAAGNANAIGLRADGTVLAAGSNKYGACDVEGWQDILAVVSGNFHSVGLRADGTVVAAGLNNSNQCNVDSWQGIRLPN